MEKFSIGKLNPYEIILNRKFTNINPRENFKICKLAIINPRVNSYKIPHCFEFHNFISKVCKLVIKSILLQSIVTATAKSSQDFYFSRLLMCRYFLSSRCILHIFDIMFCLLRENKSSLKLRKPSIFKNKSLWNTIFYLGKIIPRKNFSTSVM